MEENEVKNTSKLKDELMKKLENEYKVEKTMYEHPSKRNLKQYNKKYYFI